MRIFKNKAFHKWTREQSLSNSILVKAINEIEQGLYEANLGGGIYKKRIPLRGKGKRGGARTIVAYKKNKRAIFIYGFSKNKKDTLTSTEEDALKKLADLYFAYSNEELEKAIYEDMLIEVIL